MRTQVAVRQVHRQEVHEKMQNQEVAMRVG
jgi:hypothetical protein